MRKPRILIIDDEAKFTKLVKAYLEQTNLYEVLEEHQGARALESVRACQPDLILLDILIPDQDGTKIAAQLQADPQLKRIPIVFLTAVVLQEEVEALGGVLSCYPILAKPVRLPELTQTIENQLANCALD